MKEYFDMYGRKLEPFDVVKVYHFTGARWRKKYYMYKWVLESNGELVGSHLGQNPAVRDFHWDSCRPESMEIVQSSNYEKLDSPKKKVKAVPYFA
jgi:hypothetical protein